MTTIQNPPKTQQGRKSTWTMLVFYFLIAFEFFYMASPFAAYAYTIYRPGLDFLNGIPWLSGLSTFYLPHIAVETSSPLVDSHNLIGAGLFLIGISIFLICAAQVYYQKLTRKEAVMGGLYRFIRHPQYAAFILSSFGMAILWPRFLVLIMFVTVSFVYYFLALHEEKECLEKFGLSYHDYMQRTGMFLPIRLPEGLRAPALPHGGFKRIASVLLLYGLCISAALAFGNAVKQYAVGSLYAVYAPRMASISLARMEEGSLERMLEIGLMNADVQAGMDEEEPNAHYIAYLMPQEWFVSEVPMDIARTGDFSAASARSRRGEGHISPADYDPVRWKMIITRAIFPPGIHAEGKDILMRAVNKTLFMEVWLDVQRGEVTDILPAPADIKYDGIPVPVY